MVSGQTSRAVTQKWAWPLPTSSHALGEVNGSGILARAR